MRTVVLLGFLLAGVSGSRVSVEAKVKRVPCPGGRYLLKDKFLVSGPENPAIDAVTMSGKEVSTASGCDAVGATVKATKKGTVVRAKFSSCRNVTGRALLKAKLSLDCTTMTGLFTARKSHIIKLPFSANLSRCGDGVVDLDGGEECDGADAPCAGTCDACMCSDGTTTPSPVATTTAPSLTTSTTSTTVITPTTLPGGCRTPADCAQSPNACVVATCTGAPATCGFAFVADGSAPWTQPPGDCQLLVCDGAGGTRFTPAAAGIGCSGEVVGMGVCGDGDSAGTCVECNTGNECTTVPGMCVDHQCIGVHRDCDSLVDDPQCSGGALAALLLAVGGDVGSALACSLCCICN
jgi:hypothetical protein